MAGNNVIPFPGNGSGGAFGFGAAAVAEPQTDVQTPAQQPAPQAALTPTREALQARAKVILDVARTATLKLVAKAEPGTIEIGLFNQFGILQNRLALLAQTEDLVTASSELDDCAKATAEYSAAVDAALANAPQNEPKGFFADKKRLLIIGGILGTVAFGTAAWLVLRKPARRRKLATMLGLGGVPAAKPKALPALAGTGAARKPKRRARKPKTKK